MTELGVRVIAHVRLDRLPLAPVAPDTLAARADRQDALKRSHLSEGRAELADQRTLILVGAVPVHEHVVCTTMLHDHKEEKQHDQQHFQARRGLRLDQWERDKRWAEHAQRICRKGPTIGHERVESRAAPRAPATTWRTWLAPGAASRSRSPRPTPIPARP